MRLASILCAIALLAASPALADDEPREPACNLTGTWYGGSDAATPYLGTYAPASPASTGRTGGSDQFLPDRYPGQFLPDRYTTTFHLAANLFSYGLASWTPWVGEAVRTGPRRFEVFVIAYFVMTPELAEAAGVDGTLPEFQAVHAVAELSSDCATMTQTIDRYDDTLAFDSTVMVPFVTPPDFEWISLDGAPIVETYRRMPTFVAVPQDLRSATSASRMEAPPKRLRGR